MDNRRGLPMDMRDEEPKGKPRNNENDMNKFKNHNMPLAKQLISESEAQRMRSGFTHRHAPESTKVKDHSEAPKYHSSGAVGTAPDKYAVTENSKR